MMQPVTAKELLPIPVYVAARDTYRAEIIAYKKACRRVAVGPALTFLFEDRKTVLFQLQEMLRVENIVDPEGVAEELEVYNALLPGEAQLSATLFVEFSSTEAVRAEMHQFLGVTRAVYLVVGEHEVAGLFEEGRTEADRISSVQYVRFTFSPEAKAAFLGEGAEARLEVRSEGYHHSAPLSPEMQAALRRDLEA